MFDGISLNHRIFGPMFDPAKNSVLRATPGAEDARQQVEICRVPLTRKVLCSHEMGSRLEIASNIHPKKIGANVRRNGPEPSICVRSFGPITIYILPGKLAEGSDKSGPMIGFLAQGSDIR